MGIPIYEYLQPDEASALAEFLVEAIGLERAIEGAVALYYAEPTRRAEFGAAFLAGQMLGRKIEYLKPALTGHPVEDLLRARLAVVHQVRNSIAHQMPTPVYKMGGDDDVLDDDWEPVRRMTYRQKSGRSFQAAALHDHALLASWLTAVITTTDWMSRPPAAASWLAGSE